MYGQAKPLHQGLTQKQSTPDSCLTTVWEALMPFEAEAYIVEVHDHESLYLTTVGLDRETYHDVAGSQRSKAVKRD